MVERIRLLPPLCGLYRLDGSPLKESRIDISKITEETVRADFSSAGVLPITPDGQRILLGGHYIEGEKVEFWGPFAGGRQGNETPEETAIREAKEELGLKVELHPPTVLFDATHLGQDPNIGLIFPVALPPDVQFRVPNEEICRVDWFDWGGICQLTDEYIPTLRLWGGAYTWALLEVWLTADNLLRTQPRPSEDDILRLMHTFIGVESLKVGESPYKRVKKLEKKK